MLDAAAQTKSLVVLPADDTCIVIELFPLTAVIMAIGTFVILDKYAFTVDQAIVPFLEGLPVKSKK